MEWLDLEKLTALLGEAAASQVLHYGGFFTLAAFIHGRQVKLEIRNQFTLLTASINNLTEALKGHATRLDNVEGDVKIIKDKLGIPIKTEGE
jgi:hypothetical protein